MSKRYRSKTAWKSHKGPRRYGSYSYGKGKAKTGGQYQMSSSMRGTYRRSGFYGRYSGKNPEAKFFDTGLTDAVIAATMNIINLTIVPEGNGESDRIGRKICLKKLLINYQLKLPAATAAASTSEVVRFMVIQDKQTNGAQFAAANYIDSDNINSFNNLANSGRFRCLMKRDIVLKAGGAAPSGAAFVFSEDNAYFRLSIPLNMEIEYDNSANDGSIGTVRSNNLYFCTQSESGIAAALGNARIRYTDR